MSQVHTVHVAPKPTKEELAKVVVAADAVLEAEKKVKKAMSNPERRPWLYVGDQKLERLSPRQLKSEVKKPKPQDFYGKSLQVILGVLLESHERGFNPFPR
jgi:hypothetical protein